MGKARCVDDYRVAGRQLAQAQLQGVATRLPECQMDVVHPIALVLQGNIASCLCLRDVLQCSNGASEGAGVGERREPVGHRKASIVARSERHGQ
eukprot:4057066-Prymnesium_polylepis.1